MAEEKNIATGYIGNALRSSAADHTTTFADEIFDTERQQYQNEVNNIVGTYIENPEFLSVKTDSEGRLIWWIEMDGSVNWSKGVPKPIQVKLQELEQKIKDNADDDKTLAERVTANEASIVAINEDLDMKVDGVYVEDSEFIRCYCDEDGRLLWGIQKDGNVYFSAGIPKQIQDAITAILSDLGNTIEEVNNNKTSINLINAALAVITEISSYFSSIEEAYLKVITDEVGHIIQSIDENGTTFLAKIDSPTIDKTMDEIHTLGEFEDNQEFVRVILDAIGKVTIGTKVDGSTYIYKIDSPTIDAIIKSIPDVSKLATKEEVTDLSNRVDKISDVGDAVGRNIYQSSRLANACRINKDANGSKDFQMLIITDTHSTNLCVENAVKITNGFPTIDCLIHCGDITGSTYDVSYAKTFYGLLAKCNKPWLITIGNHDIGNTMFVYYGASHEDAYKTYIKPMVDAGILLDGEYEDGKPYYYHDFPLRKVRVISIYEYQCPLDVAENEYWEEVSYDDTNPMMQIATTYTYDENSPIILNCGDYKGGSFRLKKTVTTVGGQYADTDTMPKYRCGRADRVIMKDQAEWLIRTLNSVPSDYGIIIATHNPAILESTNQTSRKFAVNTSYKGRDQGQYSMQTDLLAEIVNAFNNMATLDLKVVMSDSGWYGSGASYLNTKVDGDLHYCYQLLADFTDRNPTAYFACYVGGHSHKDLIFKHDTYNSQYAINPLCGITERANSANCDVARPYNYDNQAYDALTTISVKKNRIALARIGNDQTIQGESRDFEIINL